MLRTKTGLVEYIVSNVFGNADNLVTGYMNQNALKAIIEDCYNEKTVLDIIKNSYGFTVKYTDSTSNDLFFQTEYLQSTGSSTTQAMSQDAVTKALSGFSSLGYKTINGIAATIPGDTLLIEAGNGISITSESSPIKRIKIDCTLSTAIADFILNGNNNKIVYATGTPSIKFASRKDNLDGCFFSADYTNGISIDGKDRGIVLSGNVTNVSSQQTVINSPIFSLPNIELLSSASYLLITDSFGNVKKMNPIATTENYGLVKPGSNINITNGTISVPVASTTISGVIKVGNNLSIDSNGVLSSDYSYQYRIGLSRTSNNVVHKDNIVNFRSKEHSGIVVTNDWNENLKEHTFEFIPDIATNEYVGVVKIGDYINIKEDGTISSSLASKEVIGVVKIGDNINVSNGLISVYTASTSNRGVVKISTNINVDSSGTISVNTATTSLLGVVKIGTNIAVSNGTISVATANGTNLGLCKQGTNTYINTSGAINVATATKDNLGVVKIGDGIDVNNGIISVQSSGSVNSYLPIIWFNGPLDYIDNNGNKVSFGYGTNWFQCNDSHYMFICFNNTNVQLNSKTHGRTYVFHVWKGYTMTFKDSMGYNIDIVNEGRILLNEWTVGGQHTFYFTFWNPRNTPNMQDLRPQWIAWYT